MRHARQPHRLPLTIGNNKGLSIGIKPRLSIEKTIMNSVLPVLASVAGSNGGGAWLEVLVWVLGEAG